MVVGHLYGTCYGYIVIRYLVISSYRYKRNLFLIS
nr:MAG TPA: hypothetical protein [Caudoviricetes sp.]